MRVLMIGDVVGNPGRRAVQTLLPDLRQELKVDLVVANVENVAGGFGVTMETAQELLRSGVDVLTSGTHVWDQKEIIAHLDSELPLLRPLNYPPAAPGRGYMHLGQALVINLVGRVFVGTFDCPFRAMNHLLEGLDDPRPSVIVVDFHAEATSEKGALGWYLDGRVSAVLGTHTHVATADARLLPKGTAFVSDVGMVGPINSVIGNEPEDVLARFLSQTPRRLRIPRGPVRFNSVLLDIDDATGMATRIVRIDRELE